MSELLDKILTVLCDIRGELIRARLDRQADACTEEEAAKLLCCSPRKVRDLRAKGYLRSAKVGHDRLYSRRNIDEFIRRSSSPSI